jgi:phosphatidylglycerol lysyltransferase
VQVSEATQAFGARIAAILVFVAGFGLLAAIATPSITARLNALANMNLAVLTEAAHVLSGMIGALLLFVAAGLWRRSKAAWNFGIVLLGLGAVTCLLKGLDWEQALAIMVVSLVLLAGRAGFYTSSQPNSRIIGPRWLAMIIGALSTIVWIASFSYPDASTQWQNWLDFSTENDLARSVRAGVGVVVTCFIALFLIGALQSKSPPLDDDDDDD